MWERAVKKRACGTVVAAEASSATPVDRVRQRLEALQCNHLRARGYGQHILIEPRTEGRPKDRDPVARLTPLGRDAFGLTFRRETGGWDDMLLVDTLDEVVADMTAAIAPAQKEANAAPPASLEGDWL